MNSDKHILKVRSLAACTIITIPAAIRETTGIEAGDYVFAEANGKRGFTVTKGANMPVKKKAAATPKKKAAAKKKVIVAPVKKKASAAPKKKILAAPAKKAAVRKIAPKPPVKKILAPKAPEQQPLPLVINDTDN